MVDLETLREVMTEACECVEGLKFKCPSCMAVDAIESLQAQVDATTDQLTTLEVRCETYKRAVDELNTKHELHLHALDRYYHKMHNCPCRTKINGKAGKCESPWIGSHRIGDSTHYERTGTEDQTRNRKAH